MSSKKKVLVTGASGFIGARCLLPLAERGYEVHAITSKIEPAGTDNRIIWHRGDLLDAAACVRLANKVRPSHLLHLAWIAEPGKFWSSPDNVRWLSAGVCLVDAFYRNGGERAVGSGTCAEYTWSATDYDEVTTPLHPDSVYGRCKLALSLAFEAAAMVRGGSAAWGRLFFPYGPGEPAGRLIPAVINGLLRGEPVDCTHGGQIRDFIYVDDVAAALVALLDSEANGAFNVGTGEGVSLRNVIAMITARLDRSDLVRLGVRQPPPGDPERVVADIRRLKQQTGWQPAYSIDAGIDATIAAWRERLAL